MNSTDQEPIEELSAIRDRLHAIPTPDSIIASSIHRACYEITQAIRRWERMTPDPEAATPISTDMPSDYANAATVCAETLEQPIRRDLDENPYERRSPDGKTWIGEAY